MACKHRGGGCCVFQLANACASERMRLHGWEWLKTFENYLLLRFFFFSLLQRKKREKHEKKCKKDDFDQQKSCKTPVRWSKYTTVQIQEGKTCIIRRDVEGLSPPHTSCLLSTNLWKSSNTAACDFFQEKKQKKFLTEKKIFWREGS